MISNRKQLSVLVVIVFGAVVALAKTLPGAHEPELKLEDLFELTANDERLVDECVTANGRASGYLKKSTDIICMLQNTDEELSDADKCIVECIARQQNLTANGLINSVAIMDRARVLFPDWNSQKLRGAARLAGMCVMQNFFAYGLVKYTGLFETRADLCRGAWPGLQCLQDPIMAEQNIQLTKCS